MVSVYPPTSSYVIIVPTFHPSSETSLGLSPMQGRGKSLRVQGRSSFLGGPGSLSLKSSQADSCRRPCPHQPVVKSPATSKASPGQCGFGVGCKVEMQFGLSLEGGSPDKGAQCHSRSVTGPQQSFLQGGVGQGSKGVEPHSSGAHFLWECEHFHELGGLVPSRSPA